MSDLLHVEMPLVRDLMNANPWTARTNTPVEGLRELMFERNVRHVPIVSDDGRLRGIVGRLQIVQAPRMRGRRHYDKHLAAHIMLREFRTVVPEDGLDEVGRLLLDDGAECLPVIGEARRLLGLVTAEDFIRFTLRQSEPRPMHSEIVRTKAGGYAIAI